MGVFDGGGASGGWNRGAASVAFDDALPWTWMGGLGFSAAVQSTLRSGLRISNLTSASL